jgi:hypothetical protein
MIRPLGLDRHAPMDSPRWLCRQSRHGRIERPAAVSGRGDRLDAAACAACRWGMASQSTISNSSWHRPAAARPTGTFDFNPEADLSGATFGAGSRRSQFSNSQPRGASTFAHITLMSSSGLSDKCSALHDKTPLIRDPTGKSICTIFAFDRHKTPFGNAKSFAPKNSFRHTVQSDHLGHPLLP